MKQCTCRLEIVLENAPRTALLEMKTAGLPLIELARRVGVLITLVELLLRPLLSRHDATLLPDEYVNELESSASNQRTQSGTD